MRTGAGAGGAPTQQEAPPGSEAGQRVALPVHCGPGYGHSHGPRSELT